MQPQFQIRIANITDAAAACDVLRRSITELGSVDHEGDPDRLADWLSNKTPENVARWIGGSSSRVFVACEGAKIVGVAAMTTAGKATLNYVAPDARFRGVSAALLARLEQAAREFGLPELWLESTKTSERFYRARGYQGDRAKMRKDIAPTLA